MRLKLTVKAPMRVGGREQQINKLEYVLYRGKLHAINPRKLAKLLFEHSERTLGDWSAEVLTRGQNADLTSFLSQKGLLTSDIIEGISRYSVRSEHQRMNEFQPHARDGFGKLFVPGSAIKGGIRSAVMYALVDQDRANEYVRTNRRGGRSYAGRLDRDTLQSYELPNRDLRAGPHFDLLRAVKVADAYGELESRIEKVTIQSYTEDRRGRTASLGASNTIYVECLVPGSWVEFDLKVDEKILRDFESRNEGIPFEDEASLLRLVREFYGEVWGREQSYYHGKSNEAVGAEAQSDKPPSFEEWLVRDKGITEKPSRRNRKPLLAEYRRTFDLFETDETGRERERADTGESSTGGIRDGAVKVGKIKDSTPKLRRAFGSGGGVVFSARRWICASTRTTWERC
jgi:CRISPR-associated protein Csm5